MAARPANRARYGRCGKLPEAGPLCPSHVLPTRPGHPPGRVGFGSGQKKPGVFSSGPCPTRPGGRAVKLSPHPTRQPVGSGRVRVGSGRAYVKCRVPSGFSGFGSKFLARARPVSHTGSKILTRARPSNSSGRVGSGYFRAGLVGSVGSGSPCPGLLASPHRKGKNEEMKSHIFTGCIIQNLQPFLKQGNKKFSRPLMKIAQICPSCDL